MHAYFFINKQHNRNIILYNIICAVVLEQIQIWFVNFLINMDKLAICQVYSIVWTNDEPWETWKYKDNMRVAIFLLFFLIMITFLNSGFRYLF